ncbi:hypothetical protein BCR44DRAFT_1294855 [Catenaria anguillulae PL171]|uniref:Uncharacterized protein n=1 Tax=Catenaria anguillulae PL171 TaxID=765915 RepID=A0A1Y2HV89_9FUNG|nr:hypothetical protein BCR44DRAFT_1294855 [Catenaria anguillulae PL171]
MLPRHQRAGRALQCSQSGQPHCGLRLVCARADSIIDWRVDRAHFLECRSKQSHWPYTVIDPVAFTPHHDLSGNDLSGELPDMFRNMSYIALYGNRFSGPVPPLPILPSTAICELWLQKNDRNQFTCLRGDPSQHSGTCYNKLAPLNLPPCPPDLDRSLSVLFPAAVGSASAALLAIVLAVFFVRRRRRRQHAQAASATRAVTVLTREELVLPTSTGLDDDGVPFVCRGIAGGEELMLPGCQVLVDQDGLEVESLYLPGEFLHSQAECPVSPGGSDGECKQDG